MLISRKKGKIIITLFLDLKCHFFKKAVLVNKKISQRKSFVGMFGKL